MLENSSEIKEKSRHGCLTAYLVILIIGNLVTLVFRLLSSLAPGNKVPVLAIIAYSLLALFIIVCAAAVYNWKKWGVWGLCAVAVINFVTSIISGELLIISIFQLVVILGILFWVLNIGGDNKGWPQLE
jgi:hypothetical protein